ncbi:ABC transporter permease subunit [Salisediminibacterium selenitireducens]|uniref:Glutathione transport system permease protein GsiD n=1 Tax=Bacillus selenitireducens (strain ATCC 700615 / DSM 15326 / MLS10) TaxID=439292 RepID=D6Y093_BACIE|nr:ABC transporter permease subunit [Salisediminibacterium selenitireducens]ADH98484.1 binding-protein-dependent transport systems inner membrane component [[Bacillus] selenitireducens MLS10]
MAHPTKKNSPFRIFLRKFLKQRLAVFAFFVVMFIMMVGLFGSHFSPYDPHRPVTAQYPEMGIDIQNITSERLLFTASLSDGTSQSENELQELTGETEERRVAAVRRTQSGIQVTANANGSTLVFVESGPVRSAVQVLVEGEFPVDDTPALSSLHLTADTENPSPGQTATIDVIARFTDGSELTGLDAVRDYVNETYGEEEEEDDSGFQTGSVDADDDQPFRFVSQTEETLTVDEDGQVTFIEEGEGVVQLVAGDISAAIQFDIGNTGTEPIVTSIEMDNAVVELVDAYKHQEPSAMHLFGTDHQNRDIFSRVIHGTQETLLIGFVSVAIGTVVGTILGLLAGYYGGWLDSLITRMTDILLAFPGILLAIAVIAFLGAGITNIIIAVAVFTIPVFVRIVRGSTLSLKESTYVEAARSIGVRNSVIIFRHIFPGTLSVVMVYLTMRIGVAILIGAALSFLGLGGDITAPEWGSMLSAAKDNSSTIFHATFFPGLAIVITVLSFNIFGDGLRDALDPKLKE